MEHAKTKDTLLFQNLSPNLSTEEDRRGQIAAKAKQNESEQQQLQENLHKLLAGDKKLASRPLWVGKLPNIFIICCQKCKIAILPNTNMYINKSTI